MMAGLFVRAFFPFSCFLWLSALSNAQGRLVLLFPFLSF